MKNVFSTKYFLDENIKDPKMCENTIDDRG